MSEHFFKEADSRGAASFVSQHGPNFNIERSIDAGFIGGIDEVGRGCLAGPLCVGLVVYPEELYDDPPDELTRYVDDSKKLSHKKRIIALDIIERYSLFAGYSMVSHRLVDELNINGATQRAIEKLIAEMRSALSPLPGALLIDGNMPFHFDVPFYSIKSGDRLSLSIASASIVAKVHRDAVMDKIDRIHPEYGFCRNKGYGTKEHREAIMHHGFCPLHRRSYEPVKSMVVGEQSAVLFKNVKDG